jgi:phage terminase Nu1 subunit (DNA packaging protein)
MAVVAFDMPDRVGGVSSASTLVNKRELAPRLNCSVPTVDALISRYPDFPVVQRGTNGRPWVFDLEEVVTFLRERRAVEVNAATERDNLLQQFTLPFLEEEVPAGGGNSRITPAARRQLALAVREERKNAIDAGLLVSAPRMQVVLGQAFDRLGRMLDILPKDMGRQFGLAPDVVAAMTKTINDERRRVHGDVVAAMTPDTVGPGAGTLV